MIRDMQHSTVLAVVADWHELVVFQSIM